MKTDLENKEQIVFEKIRKLEDGDDSDQSLAFDLLGMLGNELTSESYESRLEIANEKIDNHINKKHK